jgi:hypothetical protein
MSRDFARGLSDGFMAWLQTGTGRALREAFRDEALDIRLRDDYFNVYEAQCSLARVEWRSAGEGMCQLKVHEAYLRGGALQSSGPTGRYVSFAVTDSFVTDYVRCLPDLRQRAAERHGNEGRLEAKCLKANLAGTPLLVFDRQVVLPGLPDRIDVLAVSADRSRPLLVAVELKRGLNNDIQSVAGQTLKSMQMLDPYGEGLRHDVALAYARVCAQMLALGLRAPDPALIKPGMAVAGLAALAEYSTESRLLQRAESDARSLRRPVGFCQLDMSHPVLPDPESWMPAEEFAG